MDWLRDHKPYYGVLIIIALTIALSIIARYIGVYDSAIELSQAKKIGRIIDSVFFPLLGIYVFYKVGQLLGGIASLSHIVTVLVWSQLPVLVLSALEIIATLAGLTFIGPVYLNMVAMVDDNPVFTPDKLTIDFLALAYFIISTVFYLWSFQILLTGLARVEKFTMKQAIWLVTLAAVLLMLLRLPVTFILGDLSLLDYLGLAEVIEIKR